MRIKKSWRKFKTRKDWRRKSYVGWLHNKKGLKRECAKRSRLRPITDETPYKRLADPWDYS